MTKKKWKPKDGDRYWYPDLSMTGLVRSNEWTDCEFDRRLKKRGLVFRLKRGAVAMAETLLTSAAKSR